MTLAWVTRYCWQYYVSQAFAYIYMWLIAVYPVIVLRDLQVCALKSYETCLCVLVDVYNIMLYLGNSLLQQINMHSNNH